jgi:hypothetical protein
MRPYSDKKKPDNDRAIDTMKSKIGKANSLENLMCHKDTGAAYIGFKRRKIFRFYKEENILRFCLREANFSRKFCT